MSRRRTLVAMALAVTLILPLAVAGGDSHPSDPVEDVNQNPGETPNRPGGDLGADPWPVNADIYLEQGTGTMSVGSSALFHMEFRQGENNNFRLVNVTDFEIHETVAAQSPKIMLTNASTAGEVFRVEWWTGAGTVDPPSQDLTPGASLSLDLIAWGTLRITREEPQPKSR